MTTPMKAVSAPSNKGNPLEVARKRIGARRGIEFLGLLADGDISGLEMFRGEYLTPKRPRENYGAIKESFNSTVGETLARDYAAMNTERSFRNTRHFLQEKLHGLPVSSLPREARDIFHKKLKQLYQS